MYIIIIAERMAYLQENCFQIVASPGAATGWGEKYFLEANNF
jgi:hypothetical protein